LKAEEYIYKLARIYRYLLDEKQYDIVPIEKELVMIESLIYLLKIKHNNNVIFTFDRKEFTKFNIAPFTLQLLIENAVKHNIITKKNKLIIEVFIKGDYVIVKNNVLNYPENVYSSGIGLSNIIKRYKLLTNKDVIIEESEQLFIVKIPNIKT